MAEQLDTGFVLDLLAMAARDTAYRRRAKRLLDDHVFPDPRHRWFWEVLGRFSQDDVFVPRSALPEVRQLDEEEWSGYIDFLHSINEREVLAPNTALARVEVYRDVERIRGALAAVVDLMDKDSVAVDDVRQMRDILRDGIRHSRTTGYKFSDFYEDFPDRQAERQRRRDDPETRIKIPTRFMPTLDRDLEGGIEPGELGLLAATTGRGKSALAVNIALEAAKFGAETFMLGTEMSIETNMTRADASAFDVEFARLKRFDLTETEIDELATRWEYLLKKMRGKFRIASTPVRGCTRESIDEMLDRFEDEKGEKVKLLVLDSGDHVMPTRYGNRRERESEGYLDIKDLAETREISIWSTTHAAKAVVDRKATAENVGESYDKSRLGDIFVSANQNERQRAQGVFLMFVGKNRQGVSGHQYFLRATMPKLRFEEVPEGADQDPDEDDDPEDR